MKIRSVYGFSESYLICLECIIADPFFWFSTRRFPVRELLFQSHYFLSLGVVISGVHPKCYYIRPDVFFPSNEFSAAHFCLLKEH